MNTEEFDSRMNFIVERQAQFALEMEKHQAWHLKNDEKHQVWKTDIEGILTRLARVTNEGFKDTQAKINALIDSQMRTEEAQRKTDEQMRKTEEQMRRTDELLRRHLGGRKNGQE